LRDVRRRLRPASEEDLPDLPAVLIVEGSSWEIEAAGRVLPGIEVLRKPFKLAKLLSLLRQLETR
jgi:hypothetical protein